MSVVRDLLAADDVSLDPGDCTSAFTANEPYEAEETRCILTNNGSIKSHSVLPNNEASVLRERSGRIAGLTNDSPQLDGQEDEPVVDAVDHVFQMSDAPKGSLSAMAGPQAYAWTRMQ